MFILLLKKREREKKAKEKREAEIILLHEDCYLFWVLRPHLEVMYEYPITLYCVKGTRMNREVLKW